MTAEPSTKALDPVERIARYLRGRHLDPDAHQAAALAGDASDRRYFRLSRPDGSSIVLAVYAGPIAFAELPFANVSGLFQRLQLPVPAILDHSDALGIVAQEDLGDVTLQTHLRTAAARERTALYRQAIDIIVCLQERGAAVDPAGYLPYRLAFDVEKLTWELDFFVTHFLEGYCGAGLSSTERTVLSEEWTRLAGELAAEPRVLCHRDYHSRNLMVQAGRLSVVDFQDARMGPDTYDLVSLLRDSYVDVAEQEVDDHVLYFLASRGLGRAAGFRERFDRMAVQRNLKALGTFGYQATVRQNRAYVPYMARTVAYVRANLAKYARFNRLHAALAPHFDGLQE